MCSDFFELPLLKLAGDGVMLKPAFCVTPHRAPKLSSKKYFKRKQGGAVRTTIIKNCYPELVMVVVWMSYNA